MTSYVMDFISDGVYKGPSHWAGSISISEEVDFSRLVSTDGSLDLENSPNTLLPNLERVGGSLDLDNSSIRHLPKLLSVGGALVSRCNKTYAPLLEEVKYNLYISNLIDLLRFPRLSSVRTILLRRTEENTFSSVDIDEARELLSIPEHELVLHTGHRSKLVREAVKAYLSSFVEGEKCLH